MTTIAVTDDDPMLIDLTGAFHFGLARGLPILFRASGKQAKGATNGRTI
jgi:hypothetical protein